MEWAALGSALLGLILWWLKRRDARAKVSPKVEKAQDLEREARVGSREAREAVVEGNDAVLRNRIDGLVDDIDAIRRMRKKGSPVDK